jgi:hypothetical protein
MKNLNTKEKYKEAIKRNVSEFFFSGADMTLMGIVIVIINFYVFSMLVTIVLSVFYLVYVSTRIYVEGEDVDIIAYVFLIYLLLNLLTALIVLGLSDETITKTESIVYKDVKFVGNGFKMVANYSTPEKLIIVDLPELEFWKMNRNNCVPVKQIIHKSYYKGYKQTEVKYGCLKDLKIRSKRE